MHVSVPNRSFGGHRESVVSNSSSLRSTEFVPSGTLTPAQIDQLTRVCGVGVGGWGGGGVINYDRDQDVGSHCNRFIGRKNITLRCYSL